MGLWGVLIVIERHHVVWPLVFQILQIWSTMRIRRFIIKIQANLEMISLFNRRRYMNLRIYFWRPNLLETHLCLFGSASLILFLLSVEAGRRLRLVVLMEIWDVINGLFLPINLILLKILHWLNLSQVTFILKSHKFFLFQFALSEIFSAHFL